MSTEQDAMYRALWVEKNQQPPNDSSTFSSSIASRPLSGLPEGDVLVRVKYSSLNYKDALSATGNVGVTRNYPHTPGIDAAGIVERSNSDIFAPGDEVIVTGYDLGMNTFGGLAEYISVPVGWLVPKPKSLSLADAMALGTAGFTAAMCVDTLQQVGITPSLGPVVVTGATGGVGSISCWLLSCLGFEVHGVSSKKEQQEWLHKIGVAQCLHPDDIVGVGRKPMGKPQWVGAVDTVGGNVLASLLKQIRYGGSVACCGMAAGADLNTSVFPFILRGINLMGIDSVELPLEIKMDMWRLLGTDFYFESFNEFVADTVTDIELDDVVTVLSHLLKGQHTGRYRVSVS